MALDIHNTRFDTRILFKRPSFATDTTGKNVKNYAAERYGLAEIEFSQSESVLDSNFQIGQSAVVKCYKVEGITDKWRIVYDEAEWEITQIDKGAGRNPYMQLTIRRANA